MENVIYYDKFMDERHVLHCDTAKDSEDCLRFLIENEKNADIVSYNKTDKFSLLSVDVLKTDENNNYYYDFYVARTGDILDNISFKLLNQNINTKISFYIGGYQFDPNIVKEVIFCAAMYHEFKIRITFLEKPLNEIEFAINSRVYFLGDKHRKQMAKSTIITKTNIYRYGDCLQLNNL